MFSPKKPQTLSLRSILASFVPEEQWKRAEKLAQKTNQLVGDVLIEQSKAKTLPQNFRRISAEEISIGLANYFNITYQRITDDSGNVVGVEDSPELKELIPRLYEKVGAYYQKKYMPLRFIHKGDGTKSHCYLLIAFRDLYHLLEMQDYFQELLVNLGYAGIEMVIANPEEVQIAYRAYFPDDNLMMGDSGAINQQKLEEMARNEEIVMVVDNLVVEAIKQRASDIHIKCLEDEVAIKYRVDGVLVEHNPIPISKKNALIARIKILAGLNILERRLPQDGKISSKKYEEMNVQSLRVSTLPTPHGESVVMRLLSGKQTIPDIRSMGMSTVTLDHLKSVLREPEGIFLVTGPTGSGKSTTLATILQHLNNLYKKERNIITVEDPIEYKIENATQVAVNDRVGLNFAKVLRSVLRQDPDIVLVGEIRDLETVEIAMRAALTGHQVFSTLHTNDATSSVMRLIDMGVQEYMIGATINGILAQRLIRRLCFDCRQEDILSEVDLKTLHMTMEQLQTLLGGQLPEKIYRKSGCSKCNHGGYIGRCAIFELFVPNEEIRAEILSKDSSLNNSRIRKMAREITSMKTLREDGIAKFCQGFTTLDEVVRVSAEGHI